SLIDPTGGQADLQQGIIRHVHKQTLLDDPVRTLRALRLAVSLDFKLAPETETAVTEAAPHLPQCSNERIRDELLKMLQTAQPDTAVRRLSQLKCLPFILPHIADLVGVSQSPPHHEDVFSHTISVLHWLILVEAGLTAAAEPDSPEIKIIRTQLDPYLPQLQTHWQQVVDGGLDGSILLRLGAMFHDVGKKETQAVEADGRIRFFNHDKIGAKITGQQLRRLALSNQAIGRIQKIVAGHMHPLHLAHAPQSLTRRAVYRYFKATGLAGLDIAILSLADHLATYAGPGDINEWERLLSVVSQLFEHYFNHHEETVAPPPLVNGRDLMQALHLQEGPEIGRLLRLIQEAQAAGEIHTPAEALSLAHRICQY
ncbi:MAG: HDIG domain-containing protein, partial [Chloroflexi bacterium]|nr:HDIG domain-containing protein [Chloroflexota bacterium]